MSRYLHVVPPTPPAPSRAPVAPRRIEYIRLHDLASATARRNPKQHSLPDMIQSVTDHGFIDAVILDERTNTLISGHGRVATLIDMRTNGDPTPDGVGIDEDGEWLVPVQRGWASRSDTHAEAAIIGLNRLVEAGGWDDKLLAEILHDIHADDPDLFDGLGFTSDDMDGLFAQIDPELWDKDPDQDDEPDGPPPGQDRPGSGQECPNCGFTLPAAGVS